jgi:putative ubiquitin-RnfH superfamily antitoxin RatB of RatAB toxin-antitoxin module
MARAERGEEPAARLRVTVAWAAPARVHLLQVEVPAGSTLRDAVLASGLLALEPGLDADRLRLGVFGHARPAEQPACDGDRIEVYRPLAVDPKEARRVRADLRRRRGTAAVPARPTSRSG